jgi:hypothetical protein
VPLSNFCAEGFWIRHHLIAILYHDVPNPSLTIRNFFHRCTARAGDGDAGPEAPARGDADGRVHAPTQPVPCAGAHAVQPARRGARGPVPGVCVRAKLGWDQGCWEASLWYRPGLCHCRYRIAKRAYIGFKIAKFAGQRSFTAFPGRQRKCFPSALVGTTALVYRSQDKHLAPKREPLGTGDGPKLTC